MPISRKRYSKKINKKRFSKKKVKKVVNSKKRIPLNKRRKTRKQRHFFGGNGDEDEDVCPICTDSLANGQEIFTTDCKKENPKPLDNDPNFHHKFHVDCIRGWCSRNDICRCPLCKALLNPNPFPPVPNPFPVFENNAQPVEFPNLYRVEFFKFQQNPETGEIQKVKISVHNMSDQTIDSLEEYFLVQIPGLTRENLDFFGDPMLVNPNGYINLDENENNVEIPLGDMDIDIDNIETATITQTNTHN